MTAEPIQCKAAVAWAPNQPLKVPPLIRIEKRRDFVLNAFIKLVTQCNIRTVGRNCYCRSTERR